MKYRPFSRREYRAGLASWVRRNLVMLLVVTVGATVVLAGVSVMLVRVMPDGPFTWWFIGVLQATAVAMLFHGAMSSFLAHDRAAIWHLRGAWGEENTRDELRRAKRRRVIWGWVDSIDLKAGDLDHLVVTRRGGLVAIDSKWRNRADDTLDMARAAAKAQLRAEALARSLLSAEHGARHRAKRNPVAVTPVVVLWGTAQHGIPENARVDGIEFIPGKRLLGWLRALEHQPVDKAAASDVLERLERFRATAKSGKAAVEQRPYTRRG